MIRSILMRLIMTKSQKAYLSLINLAVITEAVSILGIRGNANGIRIRYWLKPKDLLIIDLFSSLIFAFTSVKIRPILVLRNFAKLFAFSPLFLTTPAKKYVSQVLKVVQRKTVKNTSRLDL